MIPDDKLLPLIMGGEITSHSHPHTVTLDQLHRMQQLEKVKYVTQDYYVVPDDDFIFVGAIDNPVTIYLHEAHIGQHITISRIQGANPVTVQPRPGQTINLQPNATITDSFKPLRLKGFKDLGYLEI